MKTKNEPTLTIYDQRRINLIATFEDLLQTARNNSDEDDADYEQVQEAIAEASTLIQSFKEETPAIYIYVEGGNIQGISATQSIAVNIYDADNAESDSEYRHDNGTPEEWNNKIDELEESGQIKGIY